MKAVAAAGSFVFGAVILAGGFHRKAHRLLAAFLFLIAGNQAIEAFRAAVPSPDLAAFRWATVFAIADPLLLYGFASVHPQRNHLARARWWILMAIAATGLLGWALWVPTTQFDDPRFAFGEAGLAFYTAAIYAPVWVAVLKRVTSGRAEPGFRLLFPAMCFATFPVWGRVAVDLVKLSWALGATLRLELAQFVALMVAMSGAMWLTLTRTPAGTPERRFVRLCAWAGALLSVYLSYSAAPFEVLVRLQLLPPLQSTWFLSATGAAVRWLLFGALVSMAVLRYEMLSMSLQFRRTASRVLVAYVFVAAASLAVAAFQESTGQRSFGLRPVEAAVIAGALLLSQGFRKLVGFMATRWYGLPDSQDHTASVDAYRLAVVQATERGLSPDSATLRQLRGELGIDERTAKVLVQMATGSSDGPLSAGQLVAGRYRVARFLGRGGAGRAFLAMDELLERDVVLKEVLFDGPDEEAAVLREARLAAGLHHPNVVTLFDVIRRPGSGLLVSEFVAGGSLAQRLEAARPDVYASLRIADGVLAGLDAIHSRGIVHRDLTPANVLLTREGVAKIADFGIARLRRGVTVGFNELETAHGTPEFMAPEQRRGEIATPASDVYQMGLLLQSLQGEAKLGIVHAVVERALLNDPADRWPDAGAMRTALAQATTSALAQAR